MTARAYDSGQYDSGQYDENVVGGGGVSVPRAYDSGQYDSGQYDYGSVIVIVDPPPPPPPPDPIGGGGGGGIIVPPPPVVPAESLDFIWLRLEDPKAGVLQLFSDAGYVVKDWDLGFATTRESASPRPNAHGTIDRTRFVGASAVTVNLDVLPMPGWSRRRLIDRLKAFTDPTLRPWLYVREEPDEPERRMRVRRSQFSSPQTDPNYRLVTVQWVVPSGVVEGDEQTVWVNASGAGVETGLVFNPDIVFPLVFPPTVTIGQTVAINEGNIEASPLVRLYGPCADPRIENQSQGLALEFAGLTINSGDFLEINMETKTVRYNGLATDSRYHKMTRNEWWTLGSGSNVIRFYPVSYASPSAAQLVYRSTYQ